MFLSHHLSKRELNGSFFQAAEQAKASPALVAKDPATSTNKKEEEDLAKGEDLDLED